MHLQLEVVGSSLKKVELHGIESISKTQIIWSIIAVAVACIFPFSAMYQATSLTSNFVYSVASVLAYLGFIGEIAVIGIGIGEKYKWLVTFGLICLLLGICIWATDILGAAGSLIGGCC